MASIEWKRQTFCLKSFTENAGVNLLLFFGFYFHFPSAACSNRLLFWAAKTEPSNHGKGITRQQLVCLRTITTCPLVNRAVFRKNCCTLATATSKLLFYNITAFQCTAIYAPKKQDLDHLPDCVFTDKQKSHKKWYLLSGGETKIATRHNDCQLPELYDAKFCFWTEWIGCLTEKLGTTTLWKALETRGRERR